MEYSFSFSSSSSSSSSLDATASQSNKFDIRTKFKVRRLLDEDDDDAFDCEMCLQEHLPLSFSSSSDSSDLQQLGQIVNYRLNEYGMPAAQIQTLLREAVRRISPPNDIIVDVTVWTVQKEGEKMDDVMERMVEPGCFTPLHKLVLDKSNPLRDFLMFGLPRVRFNDDKLIDSCPICLCGPTSGPPTTLSTVPCCRNAFHTHCVAQWLLARPSCPLCRYDATNWAAAGKFTPTPLDLLPPQRRPCKRKLPIDDHDTPAQPPAKRSRRGPSDFVI